MIWQVLNRSLSCAGLLAAALAAATDVLYLRLIASQGDSLTNGVVVVVATLVATCAVLAVVGAVHADPAVRVSLLAAAASFLLVLGMIGIFSIGLPLLVAAGLALAGALRARTALPPRGRPPG